MYMKQTARTKSNKNRNAGRQANKPQSTASAKNANSNSSNRSSSGSGESLLEKFFLNQLMDIYYAEQKITQALPGMVEAATTDELKEAFDDHLHQTHKHIRRLEKVFDMLGKTAEGKRCDAIEGIVREAEAIIQETEEDTMTRDAALIMAAQKVEHYEIATYGGLVQLAITMGLDEAADILDRTLTEEEDTDVLLTEIAESDINLEAEMEGNQYSWNKQREITDIMVTL
jgi:ferritin-like metal-binding protein YciE